jgi:Icc-related predicted phosphoesterase
MEYVETKLDGTGVQVFAAPGNDDFFEVDDLLAGSNTIELLEMKVHRLTDEHEIITSGWTNPTPWNTERECSEEELATRLESMFAQVQDMERCIFNIHVPPNNSKIDICPKLDENMKVVYDMGNPVMAPAGSTAVREAIERLQPLMGLHGHIHEGRGETKIGRTLCLNPGSVYSEGVLNGLLVTLADGQVKDYQFTQG